MAGNIRLYNSNGYVELQAPSSASAQILELPTDSIKPGLVHLHTETFSSVSSVSIDDIFSASYESYKVIFAPTATTANASLNARLRAAGVNQSGGNYFHGGWYINIGGTLASGTSNGATSWSIGGVSTSYADQGSWVIELVSPFLAKRTTGFMASNDTVSNTTWYMEYQGLGHNLQASYDGFSIYPNTGAISGTISVYGYRNS